MVGTSGINLKHGHTAGGSFSPTYATWSGMIARCSRPSAPGYENYGGRGISVCARWCSFENFLEDMGERPEGMTLERIDNNGHYQPSNCCWATAGEQARNRRTNREITAFGKTMLLCDWSDETGLAADTIAARIDNYGWAPERALSTPRMELSECNSRPVTFGGETHSISEWARRVGVTPRAMVKRLTKWPLDKALTTPKTMS